MAEQDGHPLTETGEEEQLVIKEEEEKDKESVSSDPDIPKVKERTGICQSCQWFKEEPCLRWQFAVFLGFAFISILWIIIRLSDQLTGIQYIWYL